MKKSLHGALAGALAALAFASLFLKEAVARFNPGFARFTPYNGPTGDQRIALRKEMIEIQERTDLAAELKFHLRERLNNPIAILGTNCYIGSSKPDSPTLARAVIGSIELSIASGMDTNQKPDLLHEQTKLKDSSYRAVRG